MSNFVLSLFFKKILIQFFLRLLRELVIFKGGVLYRPVQSEIPWEIFLERKFETDATDINTFDKISTQSL